MEIKCSLVQDLLPLYIDGLCQEETNDIITSHISSCDKCLGLLEVAQADIANSKPNISDNIHAKAPFVKVKRHYRKRIIFSSIMVFLLTAIVSGILYLHYAPVDFDAGACGGGFQTYVFDKYRDRLIDKFILAFDDTLKTEDVEALRDTNEVTWSNRDISISFDIIVRNERYRICFPGTRLWIETYQWGKCVFVTDNNEQGLLKLYNLRVETERDEYIYFGKYAEKYNPVTKNDEQYFNELKTKYGVDLSETNISIDVTDEELEKINPNFYYSERIKTAGSGCQEKYPGIDLLDKSNETLLQQEMTSDFKTLNVPENLFIDKEAIYLRGIVINQMEKAWEKDNRMNLQNQMPYSTKISY